MPAPGIAISHPKAICGWLQVPDLYLFTLRLSFRLLAVLSVFISSALAGATIKPRARVGRPVTRLETQGLSKAGAAFREIDEYRSFLGSCEAESLLHKALALAV